MALWENNVHILKDPAVFAKQKGKEQVIDWGYHRYLPQLLALLLR